MSQDITEAEKRQAYTAAIVLAERLTEAFGTPDVPPRNRHIIALRGLTDFMKEIGCALEWRMKPFELMQAMEDLNHGVVPEIFKPTEREGADGRPDDELRVWKVRSLAVLAWKARAGRGMTLAERLWDLKKKHPRLDMAPYVSQKEGSKLETSLDNWGRKIKKIEPGDHLDLVAEEHKDLKRVLDALSPTQAASVADSLLRHLLR